MYILFTCVMSSSTEDMRDICEARVSADTACLTKALKMLTQLDVRMLLVRIYSLSNMEQSWP
jgi:hypothetical protein